MTGRLKVSRSFVTHDRKTLARYIKCCEDNESHFS